MYNLSTHKLTFAALWLFVAFMPWERNIQLPIVGAAGTPIGIIAILLGFYTVLSGSKIKLRAPSLFLLGMALFVLWSAISYFWSVDPAATLTRSITFFQLLIMVWLVWQFCRTDQERSSLLQAYVYGAYLAIVVVFIAFAAGNTFSLSGRYSFGDRDPNYVAASLALGIPMAWHLLASRRSDLLYWLNLLYIPAAIFVIGLTSSRGGIVTALIALSIIPLTYKHLTFWRKTLMLALLGSMLYGAFVLIPQANLNRLLTASDVIAEGGVVGGREAIWGAGLEVLRQDQMASIFGAGSGAYGSAILPVLQTARAAHNTYLSILVANGFIGFLLFMFLFVIVAVPLLHLKPPLRTFYAVLWLTLVVTLVPITWEYSKIPWFVLAILTTQRAFVLSEPARPLLSRKRAQLAQSLPLSQGMRRGLGD
jgi:O-antigen ligase